MIHTKENKVSPISWSHKTPTLLVVVLDGDDPSSGGSGAGHDGGGVQGLDGERVDHTDVNAWGEGRQGQQGRSTAAIC